MDRDYCCSSCARTKTNVHCKNFVQYDVLPTTFKRLREYKHHKNQQKNDKIKAKKIKNIVFEPQFIDSVFSLFSSSTDAVGSFFDSIGIFARAVDEVAKSGVRIDEVAMSKMDEIMSEFKRLNDNIEGVRGEGVTIDHDHSHGYVDKFIKLILDHKETIGLALLVLFALFLYSTKNRKTNIALSIIGYLVVSYRSEIKFAFNNLTSSMSCVFDEEGNFFEPQFVDNAAVKGFMLLFYLCTFKGCNTEKLSDKFNSFFRHFSAAPHKAESTLSTFSTYVRLLQDLVNQTCKWIGVEPFINFGLDKYPLSTALLKEVSSFMKTSASDLNLCVEDAARTSQILQSRITDMLVKNKSDRDFAGDRVLLMQARSKLEEYDKELELRGAGRDITRVPPKAYLFIGKPKIGKSYLLKSLSYMALYRLCRNDKTALNHIRNNQLRDYIFTRNSCDKFWEGYYNQMLVILDEVGMQRDIAGADGETNEYSNFIKMVNDVVFPLLMANVEKKGTREFNSPLIFGTTNCYQINIESINNAPAYDRRWTAFEVEVDPRYGKMHYGDGRNDDWVVPDFDKMKELGLTDEDIALSRFLIFKPRVSVLRPGYKGDALTMDQLITKIQSDIDSRGEEIVQRQKQNEILHRVFDPVLDDEIPCKFEAQSAELCLCMICRGSISRFLSDEDKLLISERLPNLHHSQYQAIFENGYDAVLDVDSELYTSSGKCLKDIPEAFAGDEVQTLFLYGVYVKSHFLNKAEFKKGEDLKAKILSVGKIVLGFLGSLSFCIGAYKLIKGLCARDDEIEDLEMSAQVTDLNSQEVLNCIVRRNVYAIGDDELPYRGCCLFIHDNIVLLPKHYILRWIEAYRNDSEFKIHMRRMGDKKNHQVIKVHVKYFVDQREIFEPYPDQDLIALYLAGDVVQKHASLRDYLVDANYKDKQGEVCFPWVNPETLSYDNVSAPYNRQGTITYKYKGHILAVNEPIIYRLKTRSGDCGLPVVVKDPFQRSQKLFGIHVSGSPQLGIGVSMPLNKGLFDMIIEHFEDKHNLIRAQYRTDPNVLLEMHKEGKSWNDLYAPPEHLEVPGKVNLGYVQAPRVPSNTSIVPSPLFKQLGVDIKTKPAKLREFVNADGVKVDPNMIATSKYHHSVDYLDLDILDACKNSVTNLIVNNPLNREDDRVGRRVLTFEEAVSGIDGVEGLDGMPRKTSAGYPRCMSVDQRGKRDFFGEEGDYVFDSDKAAEIKQSVEDIIGRAQQGIRGNHVFMDFPKDERRPKAKVDAGKTRKISACPMDLAICIRMYFGCFIQYFQYNRIYNQSALGVNVYSSEWDRIAQYLGKDRRIIAGDYSNYDGKLPYCIMVRFLDTVTDFYGDRGSTNELVRKVLFQEIVNSRHIMNGVIYEWVGSNASGNPLTTVLNSWCNLVLLTYATLRIVGKDNLREASRFLKDLDSHVRFMVYGDDNLISVARESPYAHLLTQNAYTSVFSEMGLEYTDESKSGAEISQDRNIEEVSFLKRKWSQDWGKSDPRRTYLAPLDLDTILESIQWTKKKDFKLEYVRDNVVNMLQELSQHPEPIFNEYAPRIVNACKEKMGFTPLPNTYRECQAVILSRDGYFN